MSGKGKTPIDENIFVNIQYIQLEKRKLAVVDIKEAMNLIDYLEDLEDSLEAFKRSKKQEKKYSAEAIRKEFLENKIKQARMKRGWTQEKMALKLGTTQAFVSRIEGSSYRPSLETLEKVARILHVTVEELV